MAFFLISAPAVAYGATVTVTTVEDRVDFTGAQTIEDLPGPDGLVSLSEAFIATNNTAGHDRIEFAIPLDDGQTVATFISITGYYWRAFDSVTIDGTTQTDFGGDTNPDGREVSVLQWPLYVLADDSGVLGFHNSEIVVVGGANSLLESNTGSSGTANYDAGSGCTVRNNTGNTLKITGSDNVVVGNTFDRIRVWNGANNRIGGPDPTDRNILRGYGYVNSEGLPAGAAVELFNTTDVLIENNWIGTLDGLTQGNIACTMGIKFTGTNSGAVIRDNLISGILGHGQGPHHAGQLFGWAIYMEGTSDDISIVGNILGLDITGEPTLGAVTGVSLGTWATISLTNIRIGQDTGDGNIIAGQIWNGIVVDDEVQEVRIQGNVIWGNGQLGIDLLPSGVSPNDPLDADSGGNGLQNFPELSTAVSDGGTLHVTGVLQSAPANLFTVEFFASPGCDATGFGEGQIYLGATSVSTDGSGNASIDVLLPVTADPGWVVTSTATLEPLGATSEFSACATIDGDAASTPGDVGSGPGTWALNSMPNPFRSTTTTRFTLPSAGDVRLEIFDASGRLVRKLIDETLPAGSHDVVWHGRDGSGRAVPGGIYFYQLQMGGERLTSRITLLR
jgi:hypothetical protein